jgi:ABC-type bacteriocin/lantibiotic exporter with double-glycine peptidase domain
MRVLLCAALGLLLLNVSFAEPPEKLAKFYQPQRCGPTALYVVCRWHDIRTSVDELVELSGVGRHGSSVSGLIQAGKAKGLDGKGYASSIKHLTRVQIPAIVDYPMGHFSVLLRATSSQVTILDLPKRVEDISASDFSRRWGGNVIEFTLPPKK